MTIKERRTIHVQVVGSNPAMVENMVECINGNMPRYPMKAIQGIPREGHGYAVDKNKSLNETVHDLTQKPTDIFIIDGDVGKDWSGNQLKEALQENLIQRTVKNPARFFLSTDYDLATENVLDLGLAQGTKGDIIATRRAVLEGLESKSRQRQKSLDAWWQKTNTGFEKLGILLRENLFRPLSVGICGYGRITPNLLDNLIRANTVSKIGLYSETLCKENNQGEVHSLLEEDPTSSKLRMASSLEELMEDTDVLVLTSSSVSGKEIVELSKSNDRREVFPYQMEKYRNYFNIINSAGYKGLVTVMANPVALLLRLGVSLGISENQLFSPGEPDTSRVLNATQVILGEELSEDKSAILARYITGVHGSPRVVRSKKILDEINGRLNDKILTEIELRAASIGRNSQKSAQKLRSSYIKPQSTFSTIFSALAAYQDPPRNGHIYCHLNPSENLKGFAILPPQFSWENLNVRINKKEIGKRGQEDFCREVAPYLEAQSYVFRNLGLPE